MGLGLVFEVASIFIVGSKATDIVFHAWFNQETPLLRTLQLKCEILLEVYVEVRIVALPRKKDLNFTCCVTNQFFSTCSGKITSKIVA